MARFTRWYGKFVVYCLTVGSLTGVIADWVKGEISSLRAAIAFVILTVFWAVVIYGLHRLKPEYASDPD